MGDIIIITTIATIILCVCVCDLIRATLYALTSVEYSWHFEARQLNGQVLDLDACSYSVTIVCMHKTSFSI